MFHRWASVGNVVVAINSPQQCTAHYIGGDADPAWSERILNNFVVIRSIPKKREKQGMNWMGINKKGRGWKTSWVRIRVGRLIRTVGLQVRFGAKGTALDGQV